jgi:hypothetical protein
MIWALFARDKSGAKRAFTSQDGTSWKVEVRSPSASNAMVVFVHPDPQSSMRNRYAWWLSDGPESRDVTARLTPKTVLDALTDADVAEMFRRSMPISSQVPRFEPA